MSRAVSVSGVLRARGIDTALEAVAVYAVNTCLPFALGFAELIAATVIFFQRSSNLLFLSASFDFGIILHPTVVVVVVVAAAAAAVAAAAVASAASSSAAAQCAAWPCLRTPAGPRPSE